MTWYSLAHMQLHACRFRLTKKTKPTLNSCYNVQFSISWQYLSSKLQKSLRIPNLKRKVDISSNFIEVVFMWNKCPRENDLLKCIVVTHGCTGQTSILKVGGEGTTYILPPNIEDNNVFLPLLSQKLEGNRSQFSLHRNSTRRVYSSQLEVT